MQWNISLILMCFVLVWAVTLSPTDMTYIVYTRPHNSLMHILHPMSPSRKPSEWFLSSLTSVLTATLCPSSFHWGCAYHLVIGQKRLYMSPRQAFFFFSGLRYKYWIIYLSVELSYEWLRVFCPDTDNSLDWENMKWENVWRREWLEGCESWGAFHTNNCAKVDS